MLFMTFCPPAMEAARAVTRSFSLWVRVSPRSVALPSTTEIVRRLTAGAEMSSKRVAVSPRIRSASDFGAVGRPVPSYFGSGSGSGRPGSG